MAATFAINSKATEFCTVDEQCYIYGTVYYKFFPRTKTMYNMYCCIYRRRRFTVSKWPWQLPVFLSLRR